jgi:hypothetical protein
VARKGPVEVRVAALRGPFRTGRCGLAVAGISIVALLAACSANTPTSPVGPAPALDASYSSPPTALLEPASDYLGLYVAPNGDDDNDGTAQDPFRTIEKAASVSTPGTTVVVADGTYEAPIETRASGREDARITYVSSTKWGAKLVGPDSDEASVWHNYGDYVDIQGFDISARMVDGIIQSGSYGRILENRVTGLTGNCISTNNDDYSMVNNDIIGNVTGRCGTSAEDHGIYPGGPSGTISNNISFGNAGFGIHCWHNCNRQHIINNLVFDNDEGGILIGQGDGPNEGSVDADNMVVANNLVVDNGKEGIRESGATGSSNKYLNNSVSGNAGEGIDLNTGIESGTIWEAPTFVDFQLDGSGDYRLYPFSSGVDAGTSEAAPARDIIGAVRPQGRGVDVGVYEQ